MLTKFDIQDLTIRMERSEDEREVLHLAQRDSSWPPAGPRLLAVVGGRPLAAISLETGALVADPFAGTAEVAELLRARAAQLGLDRPRRGLRFPGRRRAAARSAPLPAA